MHVVVSGEFLVAGEVHGSEHVHATRPLDPLIVAEAGVLLHRVPAPTHHHACERLHGRPAVGIARDDVVVPEVLSFQR